MEHAASIDPTTSYFSTYYIPASIPGKTSFLPVNSLSFASVSFSVSSIDLSPSQRLSFALSEIQRNTCLHLQHSRLVSHARIHQGTGGSNGFPPPCDGKPEAQELKVNFTMAKPQRITSSHTASWKARASLPDSVFWFMMAKAISCPFRALR